MGKGNGKNTLNSDDFKMLESVKQLGVDEEIFKKLYENGFFLVKKTVTENEPSYDMLEYGFEIPEVAKELGLDEKFLEILCENGLDENQKIGIVRPETVDFSIAYSMEGLSIEQDNESDKGLELIENERDTMIKKLRRYLLPKVKQRNSELIILLAKSEQTKKGLAYLSEELIEKIDSRRAKNLAKRIELRDIHGLDFNEAYEYVINLQKGRENKKKDIKDTENLGDNQKDTVSEEAEA